MLQGNICTMKKLIFLFLFILALGCKKETTLLPDKTTAPKQLNSFTEGRRGLIIINNFSAKGSAQANEFGYEEDWIELFNTSANTLKLESGKWFLTDDTDANPTKFELPELTIEPYGKLIIWCDDMNTIQDNIHTNFKLSSSGEKIGLFYFAGSEYSVIDVCSFCSVRK